MLNDQQRRLLNRLPGPARHRFSKIIAEVDALDAAAKSASERRRDLHASIRTEQDSIAGILATPDPRARPDEGDAIVIMARESIALKEAELADIEAASDARGRRRFVFAGNLASVFKLLGSVPADMMMKPANRSPAVSRKGESLAAAVERCRARVAELIAERAQIEVAPYPAVLAKAKARRHIEMLAARGTPAVAGMIANGSANIEWAKSSDQILGEGAAGYIDGADALATLVWLHRDALIAAVEKEIDEHSEDAIALAPEARTAALAKIATELDGLERDEASLVEQAERTGMAIMHREEIDPHAILGISREFTAAPARPKSEPPTIIHHRYPAAPVHTSSLPAPVTREESWQ